MGTEVNASQVAPNTDVWHDSCLCHVTIATHRVDGSVFLQWTENSGGHESTFSGSFSSNSYFGQLAAA